MLHYFCLVHTYTGAVELDEKWGKKYPIVLKSWHHNWTELSAYFKYPAPVRRIIYTNNTIESFHSQLRKVTKTKRVFSSDMALLKLLYLVQENITAKWTMPMADWKNSLSQFSIIFEDRIKLDITFWTVDLWINIKFTHKSTAQLKQLMTHFIG